MKPRTAERFLQRGKDQVTAPKHLGSVSHEQRHRGVLGRGVKKENTRLTTCFSTRWPALQYTEGSVSADTHLAPAKKSLLYFFRCPSCLKQYLSRQLLRKKTYHSLLAQFALYKMGLLTKSIDPRNLPCPFDAQNGVVVVFAVDKMKAQSPAKALNKKETEWSLTQKQCQKNKILTLQCVDSFPGRMFSVEGSEAQAMFHIFQRAWKIKKEQNSDTFRCLSHQEIV